MVGVGAALSEAVGLALSVVEGVGVDTTVVGDGDRVLVGKIPDSVGVGVIDIVGEGVLVGEFVSTYSNLRQRDSPKGKHQLLVSGLTRASVSFFGQSSFFVQLNAQFAFQKYPSGGEVGLSRQRLFEDACEEVVCF